MNEIQSDLAKLVACTLLVCVGVLPCKAIVTKNSLQGCTAESKLVHM